MENWNNEVEQQNSQNESGYRHLSPMEILQLENQRCASDDWTLVEVADDFVCDHIQNVRFQGFVRLGVFEKMVEVAQGMFRHTGIYNATLCHTTVGDNCFIENVGGYICDYDIADDCCIFNVGIIATTEGATYGEMNTISVLNEAGEGNVLLVRDLDAQLAALMVRHATDKEFMAALRRMANENAVLTKPEHGVIARGAKVYNTPEITNTIIGEDCEIAGATRLTDCSIMSSPESNVFIGSGVICENTIVSDGSSVANNVILRDCFIGEACQVGDGFTASQSIFFANSQMSCGEACAAFCGPFSVSHHKSSLLIGGEFSFYNAGSATNFSNHAYKMGPLHYGSMKRGSKTASGAHLLLPATIGPFSVCLGKISSHPDTTNMPFSYLIADGQDTFLVPGRNLLTVGLYRDTDKWPKRDMRGNEARRSIVNFDWLSPYTMERVWKGKQTLEKMRNDSTVTSTYCGCKIKASAIEKGIKYYDIALRLFFNQVITRAGETEAETLLHDGRVVNADWTEGSGKIDALGDENEWTDLMGMLLPVDQEQQLVSQVKEGLFETLQDIHESLDAVDNAYTDLSNAWARRLITAYYGVEEITKETLMQMRSDGERAQTEWLNAVRADAQKEFEMGDVDEETYNAFVENLDKETE